MILVTGAAGKTGQAVIRALVARDVPVRALVYRQSQTAVVKRIGARRVMVGDMREPELLRRATSGVQAIYHICPNMSSDEERMGKIAIDAAKASGVGRFVYHSVLHPQVEAMPHHWHKMRVEEMLFTSGLDFTILQPAAYMQNVLAGWTAITEQGVYQTPYPVQTRLSMVDLEDVAEVSAIVMDGAGHIGGTYELVGPETLTQTEVARIIERRLGRPVKAEEISIPDWRRGAQQAAMGSDQIDALVKMFRYYKHFGFTGSSWTLEHLLARAAVDFDAFVGRVVATPIQQQGN